MSKFAIIEKDILSNNPNSYIISYYWWDSIITDNKFGEWRITQISEHDNTSWTGSYLKCLEDLAKWWYVPQCESEWKMFFVKRNFFRF